MNRKFFSFTFMLVGLLSFFGCKARRDVVVLQREWTANAEFAGDVWAAKLSSNYGIDLQVREGSEIIDPIKMVRSGAAQFGIASADRILRENEQGADLVVLGAACYRSPVVFLAQPQDKISSPADFKGHTIGIQPGTNTELVLRALINSAHLRSEDMKIVDSGFGVTSFESKKIDVLGAFDYDEPVQLNLKGIAFTTIRPEDFNVKFVGTVYFSSRQLVRSNPRLVQAFMNSLVDGWRHTIANPAEAINLVADQFPSVDKKKESISLQRGLPYFSGEGGKPLYADEGRWTQMSQQLIALGLLKQFSFADSVDYKFLNSALNSEHQ